MKQGNASREGPYGQKVEPRAKAISPTAVSQIGSSLGNHATEHTKVLRGIGVDLYKGRGFEAPHVVKRDIHKGGSQGSR